MCFFSSGVRIFLNLQAVQFYLPVVRWLKKEDCLKETTTVNARKTHVFHTLQ